MRLSDLRDDLAWMREWAPEGQAAVVALERLCALYDECPDCYGGGARHVPCEGKDAVTQCWRCGGTGAVLRADTLGKNAVILTALPGNPNTYISVRELARYLFGEGT